MPCRVDCWPSGDRIRRAFAAPRAKAWALPVRRLCCCQPNRVRAREKPNPEDRKYSCALWQLFASSDADAFAQNYDLQLLASYFSRGGGTPIEWQRGEKETEQDRVPGCRLRHRFPECTIQALKVLF